jgi:hypothetical protein
MQKRSKINLWQCIPKVTCNMLQRFIKNFRGTRSVAGTWRSGRPEVLTEEIVVNMYDHIVRSPKKSVRTLSWKIGV